MVKNVPVNQETQVLLLGLKDSLDKEMRTHISILTGEIHGQRILADYSPWGSQKSQLGLSD